MVHVRIDDLKEYSPHEDIRKRVVGSDRIIAEIVCYEPGQGTVQHQHPRQDEIFYVVEGRGTIIVEGQDIAVEPTSVVFVPAQTKHGIKTTDSRLLLMFIKGPGTATPPPAQ